jgi:hypothetical protein
MEHMDPVVDGEASTKHITPIQCKSEVARQPAKPKFTSILQKPRNKLSPRDPSHALTLLPKKIAHMKAYMLKRDILF